MVARRAPQFLAHCEEKEKTLETLILCLEKKLHPTEATPFEKFSSWSKWVFYGSGDLGSSRPPQLEGIEKIDYLEDTMGLIGDYLA